MAYTKFSFIVLSMCLSAHTYFQIEKLTTGIGTHVLRIERQGSSYQATVAFQEISKIMRYETVLRHNG